MVYVYVIRSKINDKNYVGITNNIGKRLREHRSGRTKGGQVLGKFELILKEEYSDYEEARKREKYLKSGIGREFIKSL